MTLGLFESLELDQSTQRTAGRQAVAVATKRAQDQFGVFLTAAQDEEEFKARLGFIQDDLNVVIAEVCEEYGEANSERVHKVVSASLVPEPKRTERTASVKESRRPKMCPYHSEVTDISLAAKEPQAGFNAMAQHAWSDRHCQGEWDGKCNFKPGMTTQPFWDEKQEKAEERRQEREQQRAEEPQAGGFGPDTPDTVETPEEGDEAPVETTDVPETPDESPTPEAEPEAPVGEQPAMAMAASTRMSDALAELEDAPSKDDAPSEEGPPSSDESPEDAGPKGGDVFDSSGPAMQRFEELLPKIIQYFFSEDAGANDPELAELHGLLDMENPGYLGDDSEGDDSESAPEGLEVGPEETDEPKDEPTDAPDELEEKKESATSGIVDDVGGAGKAAVGIAGGAGKAAVGQLMGGAMTLGTGVASGNPMQAIKGFQQMSPGGLVGAGLKGGVGNALQPAAQPAGLNWKQFSHTRQGEALKTVDVEAGGRTPFPKMDKGKFSPGKSLPDSEMSGSPHPTERQDIEQKADPEADPLAGTRAVSETQDVEKKRQYEKGTGGSWGGGVGTAVAGTIGDDYAETGGYRADPHGSPGQQEWDDPDGPHYDPPCPHCHARQGAFDGQVCYACGRDAQGGQVRPPHRETAARIKLWDGVETDVRTARILHKALTAKDFVMIADAIATAPADQQVLAEHFASYLSHTNPNFDQERFIAAATGSPSTGRDKFKPPQGEDPQLGMPGTMSAVDVEKNPLNDVLESEFDGFVPTNTVQGAIENYERS